MVLNNKAFADRMAANGNITKKQAKENLNLFLDTLIECLEDGETVKFFKFGRFEVHEMKEKTTYNSFDGEKYFVPSHKKVKFYTTEALDERIKD